MFTVDISTPRNLFQGLFRTGNNGRWWQRWHFDIVFLLEPEWTRIFPFKCGKLSWQARVFANRFEVKSAIRDVSLCKESSPVWTPALRPETTIGHNTPRLTSSCCYPAHILPTTVILTRWDASKGDKVFRAVTVLLSVLQKWTWAFPTSIKLATVSEAAQLPVVAFKIKAFLNNARCNITNVKRWKGTAYARMYENTLPRNLVSWNLPWFWSI